MKSTTKFSSGVAMGQNLLNLTEEMEEPSPLGE